ncbi:MAG: hypothetical protein ACWGHO_00670 [Candidatus Moraniibacteriota bacterium]
MLKENWKNWRYKNTLFLILSVIAFVYFLDSDFFQFFIKSIGKFGYIGSFISGLFFVSVFTVAPASAILFDVAKTLNPYWVAFFAGLGAVLGDYIILRIFKDKVFEELLPLFKRAHGSFLINIFSSPFFAWMIPLIGAIVIASPLPDEVGIGLMGLSKIKNRHFILITFLLNSVGIFIIISIANAVHN